jgi:hypothetical protein
LREIEAKNSQGSDSQKLTEDANQKIKIKKLKTYLLCKENFVTALLIDLRFSPCSAKALPKSMAVKIFFLNHNCFQDSIKEKCSVIVLTNFFAN